MITALKIVPVTVGEKIKALRKERGWSQGELGERVGIKAQNISKYEKNKTVPREGTLKVFAEIFQLPLTEFTQIVAPLDIPNLDPEIAEYMRAIPTLDAEDQAAVKRLLKALVTAKKAQSLFAS
jgi:transcriptional regulator with XRE-family HTH domain